MAMSGDGDILNSLYSLADRMNESSELGRHGIADCVGNIERGCAGFHHRG